MLLQEIPQYTNVFCIEQNEFSVAFISKSVIVCEFYSVFVELQHVKWSFTCSNRLCNNRFVSLGFIVLHLISIRWLAFDRVGRRTTMAILPLSIQQQSTVSVHWVCMLDSFAVVFPCLVSLMLRESQWLDQEIACVHFVIMRVERLKMRIV